MVEKCGDMSDNPACKSFILNLSAELFDTRQAHFIALSTKWLNEFVNKTKVALDTITIFNSLFKGLSVFLNVSDMLVSETWSVFTKSVFHAADLDLTGFLGAIVELMSQSFVLEGQRYAVYYCFDVIVRSPKRTIVARQCQEMIPRLFDAARSETSESVMNLKVSVMEHCIACGYSGGDEVFDYDKLVYTLYFEDDRPNVVASLLKMICLNNPECLRSTLSPFILFASCSEQNNKEFLTIIREEISLHVQVNSSPATFVDFVMSFGVNGSKMQYKPMGCRALLSVVKEMKDEVRKSFSWLVAEICPLLDGRLWPFKENLIDVIALLIPALDAVSDEVLYAIEKQMMRQKSVYRASAFECLLAISKRREVHVDQLVVALDDVMKNGAVIGQKAGVKCVWMVKETDGFKAVVAAVYERLNVVKGDEVGEYCEVVMGLPEHDVPEGFDGSGFAQTVNGLNVEGESVGFVMKKLMERGKKV
jgi:hypothetical protein